MHVEVAVRGQGRGRLQRPAWLRRRELGDDDAALRQRKGTADIEAGRHRAVELLGAHHDRGHAVARAAFIEMRRVGRRHRRADDRRREDLDHRDLACWTGVDRPLRAEGLVVERIEERLPLICVAVDDEVGAVLETEELIGVLRSEWQIAELLGEVLLVVALMAGDGPLRLERIIRVLRQQAD